MDKEEGAGFVLKLRQILDDTSLTSLISFSEGGDTILVKDPAEFARTVSTLSPCLPPPSPPAEDGHPHALLLC
jgi:hypothetical protein